MMRKLLVILALMTVAACAKKVADLPADVADLLLPDVDAVDVPAADTPSDATAATLPDAVTP